LRGRGPLRGSSLRRLPGLPWLLSRRLQSLHRLRRLFRLQLRLLRCLGRLPLHLLVQRSRVPNPPLPLARQPVPIAACSRKAGRSPRPFECVRSPWYFCKIRQVPRNRTRQGRLPVVTRVVAWEAYRGQGNMWARLIGTSGAGDLVQGQASPPEAGRQLA
jgi:hypothetical protein